MSATHVSPPFQSPELRGDSIVNSNSVQDTRPRRHPILFWMFAVVCVFVASVSMVFARHDLIVRQTNELHLENARGPHVLVTPINQTASNTTIDIPGSIHGYIETPVFAKVAGYMKNIRVDKGDRVQEGEVIAIIESPETDKQVADALANYRLQVVTDRRFQYLVRNDVIAQQEADTQRALMLQSKATYQQELVYQRYEIVRAEFDGIVTARYADPGTLIPQSTAPSTGNPIVAMATLSPLRIYANVPQSTSAFVRDGDPATITVSEYPQRKFTGTITRHPEALDQNTRTMLVEVDLPNKDHSLLPGMYADVRINSGAAGGIVVPDDALIFRNNKIYLPTVRKNRLHLSEITLGHDDGYRVEVSGDVHSGDLVAMNVGQSARDGEAVQPVQIAGN
jgi:membrane fusion protein (multidrug efflux system)